MPVDFLRHVRYALGQRPDVPDATKRNDRERNDPCSTPIHACYEARQWHAVSPWLSFLMPKNTVETGNCEYVANGRVCGKPPHFLHAKSGKVFCFNHYAKLSVVMSGWVNLQRKDAAAEIARLRGEVKKEQKELSGLHSESSEVKQVDS